MTINLAVDTLRPGGHSTGPNFSFGAYSCPLVLREKTRELPAERLPRQALSEELEQPVSEVCMRLKEVRAVG
jgi:hypothetical protein